MSNTNKPLRRCAIDHRQLALVDQSAAGLFAYYLFRTWLNHPVDDPSSGESASSIKSFNQKEIWTKACTFGMYALPALFIVAALIGIGRTVAQTRDSETALPVPFTNATNPICCCQFARW
jgi:hypothetical protein